MQPYSLMQLCVAFTAVSDSLVLYLPRTADLRQIKRLVPAGHCVRAVHYCVRRASKVRRWPRL